MKYPSVRCDLRARKPAIGPARRWLRPALGLVAALMATSITLRSMAAEPVWATFRSKVIASDDPAHPIGFEDEGDVRIDTERVAGRGWRASFEFLGGAPSFEYANVYQVVVGGEEVLLRWPEQLSVRQHQTMRAPACWARSEWALYEETIHVQGFDAVWDEGVGLELAITRDRRLLEPVEAFCDPPVEGRTERVVYIEVVPVERGL